MTNRFLLLLFSLCCMGCALTDSISSSSEQKEAQLGAPFTLGLQTPVTVGNLVVKLLNVEDSRCPANVTCVRYGTATAQIQLQDTRGNEATKMLYLGDQLPAPDNRGTRYTDTVQVSMGPRPFQLILLAIQPYPNTSSAGGSHNTVKMEIRAL